MLLPNFAIRWCWFFIIIYWIFRFYLNWYYSMILNRCYYLVSIKTPLIKTGDSKKCLLIDLLQDLDRCWFLFLWISWSQLGWWSPTLVRGWSCLGWGTSWRNARLGWQGRTGREGCLLAKCWRFSAEVEVDAWSLAADNGWTDCKNEQSLGPLKYKRNL